MKGKRRLTATPQLRAYVLAIGARILRPSIAVLLVFLTGTFGFYLIGKGRWSLFDTAFFTSITLTTVGFGDTLGVHEDPAARAFTIALMWVGMLVTLYAVSSITAFLVEEHLGKFFKERKMLSRISTLQGHFIICGAGTTGEHVVHELTQTRRPFVVIEIDPHRVELLKERHPDLLILNADATDEYILEQAGLKHAAGVVCALHDDSPNMLLTVLCATSGNKNLRVVSKCVDYERIEAFRRAGAASVVSPNFIGGLRMVSEMVRPHVVGFLDKMLRQPDAPRVEEVVVGKESPLVGKSLADAKIRERTGLSIVALSRTGGESYEFNPPIDCVLGAGDVCIVIGEVGRISKLRELAG